MERRNVPRKATRHPHKCSRNRATFAALLSSSNQSRTQCNYCASNQNTREVVCSWENQHRFSVGAQTVPKAATDYINTTVSGGTYSSYTPHSGTLPCTTHRTLLVTSVSDVGRQRRNVRWSRARFSSPQYQRVVSAVAALTMGQTDGRTDGETPGRCCEREAGVTLAYSCLTNHSEAASL